MSKIIYIYLGILLGFVASCTPMPEHIKQANDALNLYPDYQDITIPSNIAPLNFLIRNKEVTALLIQIKSDDKTYTFHSRSNKITFPIKQWKTILQSHSNDTLNVSVIARENKEWIIYPSFQWFVTPDQIDPYLSYRLIEPGYEVWNKLQIKERNLENFKERTLADNRLLNGNCMNCHIYGNQQGDLSMFHIRGMLGGTILNRDGKIRKLALKNDDMISSAVYGNFHPSGRYGVFSTNIIIPEFHTTNNHRLEVYDSKSDLAIADFDHNRMIISPLTSDSLSLETFPVFSSDGNYIYYCAAPAITLPDSIRHLKYSLCRIAFDADKGEWGNQVDTIWNAQQMNGSVCHPKVSPDGRYLLYTVADYGTFPIWHKETNLHLLDLITGEENPLTIVNSDRSDTYHSWSSSGRWFTFASKRGDGQYGRVYFAYIDKDGKPHKPFAFPQAKPEHDDLNLKSYNIPELSTGQVPFSATLLENELYKIPLETFN